MYKFVSSLFGVFALVFLILEQNLNTEAGKEPEEQLKKIISDAGISVTIAFGADSGKSGSGESICVPLRSKPTSIREESEFTLTKHDGSKNIIYSESKTYYICSSVETNSLFYGIRTSLTINEQVAQVIYPKYGRIEIENTRTRGIMGKPTAKISFIRHRSYDNMEKKIIHVGPFRFLDPASGKLKLKFP